MLYKKWFGLKQTDENKNGSISLGGNQFCLKVNKENNLFWDTDVRV